MAKAIPGFFDSAQIDDHDEPDHRHSNFDPVIDKGLEMPR